MRRIELIHYLASLAYFVLFHTGVY
jgi:hypothetical protein